MLKICQKKLSEITKLPNTAYHKSIGMICTWQVGIYGFEKQFPTPELFSALGVLSCLAACANRWAVKCNNVSSFYS